MTAISTAYARELLGRVSEGIHVSLLWSGENDRLWVQVVDSSTGGEFAVDIRDRCAALHVFDDPFACAAQDRIESANSTRD